MAHRKRPLGVRTRELYDKTLQRAFGSGAPTHVPDLERGGNPWPESTRETLRAAIQRYWLKHGDPKRGAELAEGIESVTAVERARVWPTEPETKVFEKKLRDCEPRVRSVLRMGLGLGLRSEGLLETSRDAIMRAVRYGKLTVEEKGRKERVLSVVGVREALEEMLSCPLHMPHAAVEAKRYDEGSTWEYVGQLLAGPKSTLSTQRNMLSRHIRRVARRAGLDPAIWTPHTLRHVFATRMYRDGASPFVIQKALGHKSVETTMKYIGVAPEDIEKFMRTIK